jgi:hypothetical protein
MTRYLAGLSLAALALTAALAAQSEQKISGHLVDAVCAKNHATEPGYKEKHENTCNLMDSCIKSGYSLILSDNRVLKFDDKGNQQALAFVKSNPKEKDLKVTVTGAVNGDTIAVKSIALN